MTFDGTDGDDFVRRERILGIVFLSIVVAATALDLLEDLHEGATWNHVLGEAAIILLCVSAGAYLWRRLGVAWKARAGRLQDELTASRADLEKWRTAATRFSAGLTEAVRQQMESWGFSPAECDVGFLLIKGLSTKEIAVLRNTSERTVRQQATTVYKKSKLEGRAQLAAFFLEELFDPIPR